MHVQDYVVDFAMGVRSIPRERIAGALPSAHRGVLSLVYGVFRSK